MGVVLARQSFSLSILVIARAAVSMVKRNLVPRVDTVQQRGGIGLVAHRHGLHEALDLPVLQDDLLLLRTQGDDGSLPGDERGLGLQLRVLAGDVRSAVARQRVGIGDHGPAVVHRQLALPGRHSGPFRLERLDKATLADAPDPEVVRHLRHHLGVGEVGGLERKIHRAGALSVALLAVAERTLRDEDLLALGDHLGVRPDSRSGCGRWRTRPGPPDARDPHAAWPGAPGLRRTSLRLLRLRVSKRDSCEPGSGNRQPDHDDDDGHSCTSHRPLLLSWRTPGRVVPADRLRDPGRESRLRRGSD